MPLDPDVPLDPEPVPIDEITPNVFFYFRTPSKSKPILIPEEGVAEVVILTLVVNLIKLII